MIDVAHEFRLVREHDVFEQWGLVIESWAAFDRKKLYRYLLGRDWHQQGLLVEKRRIVLFVMVNPSKGDHRKNDPTLRRCMEFTRTWGYNALVVCNLFAMVATDPAEIAKAEDPIGSANTVVLDAATKVADLVVVAWGARAKVGSAARLFDAQVEVVLKMLSERNAVHCLGQTAQGFPKHPLYLAGDTEPMLYHPR